MRSNIKIKNTLTMLSEMENESVFQVLQYDSLGGGTDLKSAMAIKYLRDSAVTLKQVRVILKDSAVKVQVGALSYMKGNVVIKNNIGGPIGLGKKLFAKKVTGESIIKPTFKGTGEVYLEPSFEHFTLIELFDEEIILDDGLFYACEEEVDVTIGIKKSVSSIVFGESGLFEVKLKGTGIVVLKIPVPENEVVRCKIFNERLIVDGDFAILRSGTVSSSVEKSGTSLVGSTLNGEGLVNVYEGVGEVWLLPTKSIYDDIKDYDQENDIDEYDEEDDN